MDEQRAIPELIEANGVVWGDRPADWIVEVIAAGGVSHLVAAQFITTHLDDPTLTHLGVLLDADDDAAAAFASVRSLCLGAFPALPSVPSIGGTVTEHDGRTLGIWVMPDNRQRGMLETFLGSLVEPGDVIWRHAMAARAQAVALGAPVKATHWDKADVHTWLAWQEPPGRQLHDAVKQRILRADAPYAAAFVGWFRRTFAV